MGETRAEVAAEKARMRGITVKILQAKAEGRFWWDVDVGEVGEAELPEFARAPRSSGPSSTAMPTVRHRASSSRDDDNGGGGSRRQRLARFFQLHL